MSTSEVWRTVPELDRRYEVSDQGRVRSWARGPCRVLKPSLSVRGYPRVHIASRTIEVHRLIALAFLGAPPAGLEVRHLDGNPLNAALTNLAYGTKAENMADRTAHGHDWNANKTHCPAGHAYDEDNTMRNSKGDRRCGTCSREQKARWSREHYVSRRAS